MTSRKSETSQFKFGKSSRRQGPVISTGKFTFVKDRDFPNGKTRWKCSHSSGKCPANIYTIDTDVVLFYDKHDHE
ncbi:hypothetical protein SFRURICE_012634 [Spodoptera frugiperda]|nr:hypothetical protein SFRURICE_012634 [Spodoptera frugiperda]